MLDCRVDKFLCMEHFHWQLASVVWLYPGKAGWHFVSVPKKESKEIKERCGKKKKGWGSVPVFATIGKTTWQTSLFPDKKSDGYLMPINAEVRKKEKIVAQTMIVWEIQLC